MLVLFTYSWTKSVFFQEENCNWFTHWKRKMMIKRFLLFKMKKSIAYKWTNRNINNFIDFYLLNRNIPKNINNFYTIIQIEIVIMITLLIS